MNYVVLSGRAQCKGQQQYHDQNARGSARLTRNSTIEYLTLLQIRPPFRKSVETAPPTNEFENTIF